MDARVTKPAADSSDSLTTALTDYVTYLNQLWLASSQGLVKRSFRLTDKCRNAQFEALKSAASGQALRDTARAQGNILVNLGEEWVEDVRNLAQVALMNQAEMHHWSKRLIRRWLDASKFPPLEAA